MLKDISEIVAACAKLCGDVEFVADDATRADSAFLSEVITTAINAGAKTVTVCDSAGTMLPREFEAFISDLYAEIPALGEVTNPSSSATTHKCMYRDCALWGMSKY
jgi:2-isopropylmalate synthase